VSGVRCPVYICASMHARIGVLLCGSSDEGRRGGVKRGPDPVKGGEMVGIVAGEVGV